MTSAVTSSISKKLQCSAGSYQQMRRVAQEMKRRRAEESADVLVLMTSSVTSSYSADGLSPAVARYQQSQDSSRKYLNPTAGQPDASNSTIQSRASMNQLLRYASSRKDPDARKADVAKHCNQAQSIQSTKISAEYEFSRSDKPAAKQLTIYEELSKLDVNF
ncbi:orf108b [Dorcoceras hygrometricum]|uniref:Orf108b n=1 Tax=Dorcoceras hygrometricum TaxID=472368 RepID=A0A2Z7C8N7_9LAMI|nr:orf108b [Dorcoceras hygrometricum]